MKTYGIYCIILLSVLQGCRDTSEKQQPRDSVLPNPQGELTIVGADALLPLMQAWADEFIKLHPGFVIHVAGGGTGKGIEMLVDGKADLAMVSRKLSPGEESMGYVYFPVSREGVITIASKGNPFKEELLARGLKRSELYAIYSGGQDINWNWLLQNNNAWAIIPYTRSDVSGAAETWANYLGIYCSALGGIKVEGDEGMIRAISGDSLSIGYCNAHYAYDFMKREEKEGVMIVPLDFNENGRIDPKEKLYDSLFCMQRAVYLGMFPSHLCREMALVTRGIPEDPNVISLIKWICSDGQPTAKRCGYPQLRQHVISENLLLLEGREE